jgi:putative Mn2+ efflux pump MntP
MPLIGWICVHTFLQYFQAFEKLIPWIALALLSFIGGKMLLEGIRCKGEDCECKGKLCIGALLLQGVATSIDALSVGLTLADHPPLAALASSGVIALVTFPLCLAGVAIGKKFGTGLAGGAAAVGGLLLILIGAEIFFSGI